MSDIQSIAQGIRLVLTDVDGVLTDGGVYYGPEGEVFKRFNIRDGKGVERLRDAGITTGIVTGENSPSVVRRAEKLSIDLLVLGCLDKASKLDEILEQQNVSAEQVAFIGDDVNDLEVMKRVGLPAVPADALPEVYEIGLYRCTKPGGHGAFREFAEFILSCVSVAESQ